MSTGWVAAGVRARAMSQRRVGAAGARDLAGRASVASAVTALAETPYGHDVHLGQDLAQAQHAVAATVLWNMRVLAGWVPTGSARVLRSLAGGFEVANVDERIRELGGSTVDPPFRLGSMGVAWTRAARAGSLPEIRQVLASSAWGDPGAGTAAAIRLSMRLSWSAQVSVGVPVAREWAAGAAALVLVREVLVGQADPTTPAVRAATRLLGSRWTGTRTLRAFADALPPDARWALEGVEDPGDLWHAEARWWSRVGSDGAVLLRRPVTTPAPVLGAVALLGVDAWRVRAALEVAARGGSGAGGALGVFDAVA
ncbi:MAG TPA: hypothetical protein VES03_11740 [Motilibacterales bacterium]|nr:hypothetical protein [Motilibacterales bacterium]